MLVVYLAQDKKNVVALSVRVRDRRPVSSRVVCLIWLSLPASCRLPLPLTIIPSAAVSFPSPIELKYYFGTNIVQSNYETLTTAQLQATRSTSNVVIAPVLRKTLCHSLQLQPSRTIRVPVRYQPASCTLPYIACLSTSSRTLVSLQTAAGSTSTGLALSPTRICPHTQHAFHVQGIC